MQLKDKNGLTEEEFLENYKVSDYPRPSVTADVMIFAQDKKDYELLMVKRGGHPFIGQWALPGGFANPNENVDDVARRELFEETGIEGLPLMQNGMFSAPHRDPRSWVITQSYITVVDKGQLNPVANDDAVDVMWFKVLVTNHNDNTILTLYNDKESLTAVLKLSQTKTKLGDINSIRIVSSKGIAFDHAKIIMSGLLKIGGE